ncbi:MAG: rhodanese-related sulfurtransferase [Chloroflexi bacterium]|nr:rhodanese-related sulfurtransferase [Chloroflexota bacterium]
MFAPIRIAVFYKFTPLPDYAALRAPLLQCCQAAPVRGSILLAAEGINATIAGADKAIETVLAHLREDARFADLEVKNAWHGSVPFRRMKVRLKKEIVTFKNTVADPRKNVGEYIAAEDWNALIRPGDVLVIDARNQYEVELGSFRGALNPGTEVFSELPRYLEGALDAGQHKRVALFCTGGIRCEKATSLLLARGFDEVYHLRGGILRYLEAVPREQSLWQGQCFVFDERGTVVHAEVPKHK